MTEKVKKRLCELAGIEYLCSDKKKNCDIFCHTKMCEQKITLEILVKAMWAINDNYISFGSEFPMIQEYSSSFDIGQGFLSTVMPAYRFNFIAGIESRIKALTAAIEYVIENQLAAESATDNKNSE